MKIIFLIICSLFLMLPYNLKADIKYNDGIELSKRYITKFENYDEYLLIDNKQENNYIKNEGGANNFWYGGYISKKEYDLTYKNNYSWLAPGFKYWTNTSSGLDKYIISFNSTKTLSTNKTSGVRITEFVKSNVTVSGKGTFSNPWKFNEMYTIKFDSQGGSRVNDIRIGYNMNLPKIEIPKKENFVFDGFYVEKDKNMPYYDHFGIGHNKYNIKKDILMHASWKACPAGTYADYNKNECVSCPNGYTSDSNSSSINSCYINVNAGKYIKEKKSNKQTACPAGTYKEAHRVYYGNTSSCTPCPSGTKPSDDASKCIRVGVGECFLPKGTKLTQGVEFVKGQYTYRYMQESDYYNSDLVWKNIREDGWGVRLTDKTSTDPVTTKLCTSINGKPIVSMSYMFSSSQAKSIDLSSFDTSNVVDMNHMFGIGNVYKYFSRRIKPVAVEYLDLSSFDTSNVRDMSYMFAESNVKNLDLSNFDTKNVISMHAMFYWSNAKSINTSHFNTSKTVDMSYMFDHINVPDLDVSNFDTSNVIEMRYMFNDSKIKDLDVSNFDTSKAENMFAMFARTEADKIDVSHFNTSTVIDMGCMFSQVKTSNIIDVSHFDTTNVQNMEEMFYMVKQKNIDVSHFNTSNVERMNRMFSHTEALYIDVSHFNTSKVYYMNGMFSESKVTSLDLSNFDTSNVTNMSYMFESSNIRKLDLSSFNTKKVTNMSYMFEFSNLESLDLSNFYINSDTNVKDMFYGSKIRKGYGNKDNVNILNSSPGKPRNLHFVVK